MNQEIYLPTEYLPVLIVILISFVLGLVLIYIGKILGRPQNPYDLKLTPYECGLPAVGDTRERFNVKFYIVAIVFVIFDVETIFLYPWALVYTQIGLYALIEMILFIVILFFGYIYALGKDAFTWR